LLQPAVGLWSVPLATRTLTAICSSLAVYTICFLPDTRQYVICVYPCIYMGQVWRIITSALAHGGVLHVCMNMLSFVPIGSYLEARYGSLAFAGLLLHFTVTSGVLYLAVCWAMMHIAQGDAWMMHCSVGFSGVIFALLVLQLELNGNVPQSVFGMFTVPPRVYPFAIAIAISAMMPQVSALGHGLGIAVGFLYCFGYLDSLMPSGSTVAGIDARLSPLLKLDCFVARPEQPPLFPAQQQTADGTAALHPERVGLGGGYTQLWAECKIRCRRLFSMPQAYDRVPQQVHEEGSWPGHGFTLAQHEEDVTPHLPAAALKEGMPPLGSTADSEEPHQDDVVEIHVEGYGEAWDSEFNSAVEQLESGLDNGDISEEEAVALAIQMSLEKQSHN